MTATLTINSLTVSNTARTHTKSFPVSKIEHGVDGVTEVEFKVTPGEKPLVCRVDIRGAIRALNIEDSGILLEAVSGDSDY